MYRPHKLFANFFTPELIGLIFDCLDPGVGLPTSMPVTTEEGLESGRGFDYVRRGFPFYLFGSRWVFIIIE